MPRSAGASGRIALTSLVAAHPIYKGEQITLRQFKSRAQGGIFAKFSGKERIVPVMGEPQQLLAGTLSDGDRVDVVATTRYHVSVARATTRVVLRDLLVLKAPDADKAEELGTGAKAVANIVMSDSQAQTMGWAMKMTTWFEWAISSTLRSPQVTYCLGSGLFLLAAVLSCHAVTLIMAPRGSTGAESSV